VLQIDSTRPTRGATNCQLRLRLSDEWSILRSCAQGAVCAWSFHCAHGRQQVCGIDYQRTYVRTRERSHPPSAVHVKRQMEDGCKRA
jgi:hypothetical protein